VRTPLKVVGASPVTNLSLHTINKLEVRIEIIDTPFPYFHSIALSLYSRKAFSANNGENYEAVDVQIRPISRLPRLFSPNPPWLCYRTSSRTQGGHSRRCRRDRPASLSSHEAQPSRFNPISL
jgi:hypothetical protein